MNIIEGASLNFILSCKNRSEGQADLRALHLLSLKITIFHANARTCKKPIKNGAGGATTLICSVKMRVKQVYPTDRPRFVTPNCKHIQ